MTNFRERINTFIMTFRQIELMVNQAHAGQVDWSDVYDKAFGLQSKLKNTDIPYDWCDPDMGYDDDVLAFYRGLKETADKYQLIFDRLSDSLSENQKKFVDLQREAGIIASCEEVPAYERFQILKSEYLPVARDLDVGFYIDYDVLACDTYEEELDRIQRSFTKTLECIIY